MAFHFSAVRGWAASTYQGAAAAAAAVTSGAATIVSRTREMAWDAIQGLAETPVQSLERRSREKIKAEHLEPIKLNNLQLKAFALLEEIWRVENLPAKVLRAAGDYRASPVYTSIKIKFNEFVEEVNRCKVADEASDPKSKKYEAVCSWSTSSKQLDLWYTNEHGRKFIGEQCCSTILYYFTTKKGERLYSESSISSKILSLSMVLWRATDDDVLGQEAVDNFKQDIINYDRKEFKTLLAQLKILYPKDLLMLPLRDRMLKDVLFQKKTNASFELVKSLIKEIHDSYADFVIFDILDSYFDFNQKMELFDLALENPAVCSSLYRNGVYWIKTIYEKYGLTGRILEKLCFLGFDVHQKVGDQGFVDICRKEILNRGYRSFIGSSMDIETLFTVEDKIQGRGLMVENKSLLKASKRGVVIRSDLALIQHSMLRSQVLEDLRTEENKKENKQRLNPLMAIVDSAMKAQKTDSRPVPVDLLKLIAGFNGYIYHYETIAAGIARLGGSPMLEAVESAKAASAAAEAKGRVAARADTEVVQIKGRSFAVFDDGRAGGGAVLEEIEDADEDERIEDEWSGPPGGAPVQVIDHGMAAGVSEGRGGGGGR